MKPFIEYINEFSSLEVNKTNGNIAPHKAVLLITIMDMISNNIIVDNRIPLDEKVHERFIECWNNYVTNEYDFKPHVWTPFWHLKKEPFWHFKPLDNSIDINKLVPSGQTASIGLMRKNIQYAYLDSELFDIILIKNAMKELKGLLIRTYIDPLYES